jgi:3-methyladenine DNA glycosylase AlkD
MASGQSPPAPGLLQETYVDALRALLAAHANPANAGPMRAYMKNQFAFFGIKSPDRVALVRGFVAAHGLPPVEEIEAIARRLWEAPERECQYAALDLVERSLKRLPPEAMVWIEHLIITKSWWDSVDPIASHLVGGLVRRYPDLRDRWIGRWRLSDNIWLRRTTLLYQLGFKDGTDAELLFALIRENLDSREFFIQKAIGWALREYSKIAPEAVRQFVAETPLAPLSRREALKWLQRGSGIGAAP